MQQTLIDELVQGFRATANEFVPWFLENMPRGYFEDTSEAERVWQLRSIIAARSSGQRLDLTFASSDGRTLTAVREGNQPGLLAEIVRGLRRDQSLRSARIHSALDGSFVVDTFEFGDPPAFDPSQPDQARKAEAVLTWARKHASDLDSEALRAHLANCPADYVSTVSELRLTRQRRLFLQVSGSDEAVVEVEPEHDASQTRITIAVSNSRTRTMLERAAMVLAKAGISIARAYLDLIKDPPHGSVTLVGFVVSGPDGKALDTSGAAWKTAAHEITRAKWVDHRVLDLERRVASLDLDGAELFAAFAALVHQRLAAKDSVAYKLDRVWTTLDQYLPLTQRALDLFRRRFHPTQDFPDAAFKANLAAQRAQADAAADSENAQTILATLLDAVAAVRRTNAYVPQRFALAMRLDPGFMVSEPRRPARPFGVFFVHGRGFNGFHVRFKEIARGGLRVIKGHDAVAYEKATDSLYDEVYKLAFAQQQKNKDIPEGGAKAAIVVEVPKELTRCVKAFTDAILDLITPEPRTRALVRDRLGLQEFIYLGPDEYIEPEHIEWIAARAQRRQYPLARAFISSKAVGINHKVYGVTSEGVNVFLERALRFRGIDPRKQSFSLRITGGPDGDVAGNMMRILTRDYGKNACIVGIVDKSAVALDPAGFDHAELGRLFKEGKPIEAYALPLSPRGRLTTHLLQRDGKPVESPAGKPVENPEAAEARRAFDCCSTDVFMPGGGRPETLNARNWRDFLTSDGEPSSPIIVEGANLYLSAEARKELHALGVLIFKDSSANKCGVICSSYEIQASMLLEDAAFLAIKPKYVEQVLEKLRQFAGQEATLLLSETRRHASASLPELSVRLSAAMNLAADLVYQSISSWPANDPLAREIVLGHVPQVLFQAVGERLFSDLPKAYLDWMVAKGLSSRIVYREGIDFFATIDAASIGAVVHRYLEQERELRPLIEAVRHSGIADAARAADLLGRAGVRAATFEG